MNPNLGFIIVLKEPRTTCMFPFFETFSLILFQSILKKKYFFFHSNKIKILTINQHTLLNCRNFDAILIL